MGGNSSSGDGWEDIVGGWEEDGAEKGDWFDSRAMPYPYPYGESSVQFFPCFDSSRFGSILPEKTGPPILKLNQKGRSGT